ncbi:MAG TPA: hypothetical protein VHS59_01215 [Bacillota bacterium]|nr:hypothetical protein [Bacillota bacterium]
MQDFGTFEKGVAGLMIRLAEDYPKGRYRLFGSKIMVSSLALILLLFTTACSREENYLFDSKSFTSDKGLINAEQKGLQTSVNSSIAINERMRLVVKGLVTDTIRTVLAVEILGVQDQLNIVPELSDIEGNTYALDGIEKGTYPGAPKGEYQYKLVFKGGPKKDTSILLRVTRVGNIKGTWVVTLPVKVIKPTVLKIGKAFSVNDTVIKIDKIVSTASTLEVSYQEQGMNVPIVEGSISSEKQRAKFLQGSQKTDGEFNSTGIAYFEPLDLTKSSSLKWLIYTDYNTTKPIEINVPLNLPLAEILLNQR